MTVAAPAAVPIETIAPAAPADAGACPPAPENWAEVGLSREAVTDLLLKLLYVQGAQPGEAIAAGLRLPFHLVDELLVALQQRRLAEVRGTHGNARGAYVFDLGTAGRDRAREALQASQYVGPAPVPLARYTEWTDRQAVGAVRVSREEMRAGLRGIVVDDETLERLGPAVNSGKSLFLHGDSGNGKTLLAGAVARMLGGDVYVPYAVDVEGETMLVYDPVVHRSTEEEGDAAPAHPLWRREEPAHDRRWKRVRRPVVATGGELTLAQLDLQYDPFTKMYQAPFQVKANGGVLILDDFGRQQVPPQDLLNRWIVPLEQRIDYLTLHTGGKFSVPFDCLLVISTNLDPRKLMEEAFLRRIRYKILVGDPTRAQYAEIFRGQCEERGVPYDPAGVDFVYREIYERRGIHPRGCHPRDVVEHVCDVARFLEVPPALTDDLLRRACESYFLELAG